MKVFKYVFFLILIVIIGCAIYIAVQPNSFEFSRSRVINAPAPVVFNTVNDFEEWPRFSPWMEQDLKAQVTYDDKTVGEGAGYSWNGDVLGVGSMETETVVPYKFIAQQIHFVEPFESTSAIDWTFEPVDHGTKVTWSMKGKQDFMTKMYVAFAGTIEKNTAPDFERGLFKLDSITQADMKAYTINIEGITQHSGGFYLYTTASVKMTDYEAKMQSLMQKVGGYARANNITIAGNPFVIYHTWDKDNNAVLFSCCIPTSSKVISSESDILTGQLEPFKAIKTTLKGDYNNLKEAWDSTMDYVSQYRLTQPEGAVRLESYITDPASTPNPADWITELYLEVE